jgi:nitroreductase
MTFAKLVAKNRSYRGFDNTFTVRADQLRRIMEVVPLCPSARNQQVLRLRPVLTDEADKVLPHIRLGGALRELKLPLPSTEPRAFIVICSAAAEDKYVNMDIGIIAQTMLLQAVEIGLNGICIGAFDHNAVQQSLNLPYEPLLIVAIGRGAETIRTVEITESDSHIYYREEGIHYVPKLPLEAILLK